MDFALIQGAVSGLKTASDIAKGLLDLKTLAEVQGKVIELQSAILSAQSSALSATSEQAGMAEEIRALKTQIASLQRWDEERQRYKLVRPFDATTVYALKPSFANGDPAHWLCTTCYENGRKSILNPRTNSNHWATLVCATCKAEIASPWRNAPEPQFAPE